MLSSDPVTISDGMSHPQMNAKSTHSVEAEADRLLPRKVFAASLEYIVMRHCDTYLLGTVAHRAAYSDWVSAVVKYT
jgi:hypothetical protein